MKDAPLLVTACIWNTVNRVDKITRTPCTVVSAWCNSSAVDNSLKYCILCRKDRTLQCFWENIPSVCWLVSFWFILLLIQLSLWSRLFNFLKTLTWLTWDDSYLGFVRLSVPKRCSPFKAKILFQVMIPFFFFAYRWWIPNYRQLQKWVILIKKK